MKNIRFLTDYDTDTILYRIAALITVLFFMIRNDSVPYVCGAALLTVLMFLPGFKRAETIKIFPGFWVLLFFTGCSISLWKYLTFNDVGDVDFACYTNVLSNTVHGRFLYHSFLSQNLFAVHSSAALLLFLPFYMLGGNIGLLIAQTAAWCWGIYLIFRTNREYPDTPLLLVVGVALLPYLLPGIFYGFHIDILIVPEAGIALYAYKNKKFRLFIFAMILMFLTKEVFIMLPFLFSIVAFGEKRDWKWTIIPLMSSVIYLVLYWYLIAPALRQGNGNVFEGMYPHSPAETIRHLFSLNSILFILNSLLLYLPFYFLSLKYLLMPLSYILFYASFPDSSFQDSWRHYVLVIGIVSLFPIIHADVSRMKKLAFPVLLIALCAYPQWLSLIRFAKKDTGDLHRIRTMISSIPLKKSIVAHGPFIAHVANHPSVANWIYRPQNWPDYEYLLFDRSFRPSWWAEGKCLDRTLDSIMASEKWNVKAAAGTAVLLKSQDSPE